MVCKIEDYQRKLEKELKSKEYSDALFNSYSHQIKELAVLFAIKYSTEEEVSKETELSKYSFLLSKENYIEHAEKEIEKKVKELSIVDCFKEIFNKELIQLNFKENKESKKEKEKMFMLFEEEHDMKGKKRYYLEMKKNKMISKVMEFAAIMFSGVCIALLYNVGMTEYLVSLSILLALSFTFISSTGEFFENIRFQHKIQKVMPNKLKKGLNFVSFCYFIIFSLFTIILCVSSYIVLIEKMDLVFGLKNEETRNIIVMILFLLTTYWHFRSSVYQKRYSVFKKFEEDNSKEDVKQFLTHINEDWLKVKKENLEELRKKRKEYKIKKIKEKKIKEKKLKEK